MNRVSPASRKARRKPLRVSTRRGFTLVELLVSPRDRFPPRLDFSRWTFDAQTPSTDSTL